MRITSLLSFFVVVTAFAANGATQAWPGFRGANSSGVCDGGAPPVNVSPSNSVLWKVQVPWSPSSPCIWDDQIFLTTFSDGELQTRCYRREDGKLSWTRGVKPEKVEMFHSTESSPAVPTPSTDGQKVVSY